MPAWECAGWSGPKPCWGLLQQFTRLRDWIPGSRNAPWCWYIFFYLFLARCNQSVLTAHLMGEKLLLHLVYTTVFYSLISQVSFGWTKQRRCPEKAEMTRLSPMSSSFHLLWPTPTALSHDNKLRLLTICLWGHFLLHAALPALLSVALYLGLPFLAGEKKFVTHLCSKKSEFYLFFLFIILNLLFPEECLCFSEF